MGSSSRDTGDDQDARARPGAPTGLSWPQCAAAVRARREDDYLLFDCPGQIELYSHVTVFRTLVDFLKNRGWQVGQSMAVALRCDASRRGSPRHRFSLFSSMNWQSKSRPQPFP